MTRQFVQEEELLQDAFRLAVAVFASGFRPDFIVGLWRGGATVGIYVQECLQYLGVETDHLAIRSSYRGMRDYPQMAARPGSIDVEGLQYLIDHLGPGNSLLIVDDVSGSGHSVEAVIRQLRMKLGRSMPAEVRLAVVYYKPLENKTGRKPDYFLHETSDWLVMPYELTGLSQEELARGKPWVIPILGRLRLAPR